MKIHKGKKIELENKVKDLIVNKLSQAIKQKGNGILVVPGGGSPSGVFNLLMLSNLEWQKIHIFLADERWVLSSDKYSNYKNLEEKLLSGINIPTENIHQFSTLKGVDDYQRQLMETGDQIDVCLLGVGPDGHIASLFPNHPSVEYGHEGYFEVNNSPKEPARRISLSKETIIKSKTIILLIFGEEKEQAFNNFTNDELDINDCPAKIAKEGIDSYLFTDINK